MAYQNTSWYYQWRLALMSPSLEEQAISSILSIEEYIMSGLKSDEHNEVMRATQATANLLRGPNPPVASLLSAGLCASIMYALERHGLCTDITIELCWVLWTVLLMDGCAVPKQESTVRRDKVMLDYVLWARNAVTSGSRMTDQQCDSLMMFHSALLDRLRSQTPPVHAPCRAALDLLPDNYSKCRKN